MITPGIASYPMAGPPVPQIASQPVHLADFARRASEFGELKLPGGHVPSSYGLADQYRPNSAPGPSYHMEHDVPFAMGNKRRKLDQMEIPGVPRSAPVTIKPELSRAPSVLGSHFPGTSDAMRHQVLEIPNRPSIMPQEESAGRETAASTALAETTARLARLERLLTLQDHTYAEKRLRLAEEAALRMLEGGGEAGLPGVPQQHTRPVNGRSDAFVSDKHSQHRNAEPLRIDTRATEANGSHQRTVVADSADHDDDGNESHPDSADVKGRFGRWDTVEIIGDAGYTGAEGLNALTEASVLVRYMTRFYGLRLTSYTDKSADAPWVRQDFLRPQELREHQSCVDGEAHRPVASAGCRDSVTCIGPADDRGRTASD